MKITQEVRDYAAAHGTHIEPKDDLVRMLDVEAEMKAKAEEFRKAGSQLYSKV